MPAVANVAQRRNRTPRRRRQAARRRWNSPDCAAYAIAIAEVAYEHKTRPLVYESIGWDLILDCCTQQVLILLYAMVVPAKQVSHDMLAACKRAATNSKKMVIGP